VHRCSRARGGGGLPSVVRLSRRPEAPPGARGLVTRPAGSNNEPASLRDRPGRHFGLIGVFAPSPCGNAPTASPPRDGRRKGPICGVAILASARGVWLVGLGIRHAGRLASGTFSTATPSRTPCLQGPGPERERHRGRYAMNIDSGSCAMDDAGHAQAGLGLPEAALFRRGARGAPPDARAATFDGLRVRALPESRRVPRVRDGDLPDPRRRVHAPLRLLCDRQGDTGPARPGGARGRCGSHPTPRALVCRRDLRDPRRSAGRRGGSIRRDDPGCPRAGRPTR
jgi:hypothetical protein